MEVNEEIAEEQQTAVCQEIVQAKLLAVLFNVLENIGSRIDNLELVDQKTYLHEIAKFKAALGKFYQDIQFLTYDVEYGLNDQEGRVAVPFKFKGDSMDRLSVLEAVTLIMKLADSSLDRVNGTIKGFNDVINEAQERLADAELADSEKDAMQHNATIESRGKKKAKQEKRKDDLVKKINAVLRVDPEDRDALMAEFEQLLTFLIQNQWIKNSISMDQAKTPAEMLKSFNIKKNVEKPEKEETSAVMTKKHGFPAGKLIAGSSAVALAALMSFLFSSKYCSKRERIPKPPIYEYTKSYKSGDVTLIGFYKNSNLNNEEKYAITAENAYRVVAGIMRGGGISQSETNVLEGKAYALSHEKLSPGLADCKTYILNYKEEILNKKCVSSVKSSSMKNYINTYALQVRRTMIVSTVIDDETMKPINRPLTVVASISRRAHEPKRAKIDNMKYYHFDNTNGDLEYKLTTNKNGKAGLIVRRKNGKTLLRVRGKKKR